MIRRRDRQRQSKGDEAMKTSKTLGAMGMLLMLPMSAQHAAEADRWKNAAA
jgi:hypothetical protein